MVTSRFHVNDLVDIGIVPQAVVTGGTAESENYFGPLLNE